MEIFMKTFSNARGELKCSDAGMLTLTMNLPTGPVSFPAVKAPTGFDADAPWATSPTDVAKAVTNGKFQAESFVGFAVALRAFAAADEMDGVDRDRILSLIDMSLTEGQGADDLKISVLRHDLTSHGFSDFLDRGPKPPMGLNKNGKAVASVLSSLFEEARTLHRAAQNDADMALC